MWNLWIVDVFVEVGQFCNQLRWLRSERRMDGITSSHSWTRLGSVWIELLAYDLIFLEWSVNQFYSIKDVLISYPWSRACAGVYFMFSWFWLDVLGCGNSLIAPPESEFVMLCFNICRIIIWWYRVSGEVDSHNPGATVFWAEASSDSWANFSVLLALSLGSKVPYSA